MDLLDPLDSSVAGDDDHKVIINEALHIEDHSMGSDDDPHVDHLSPQTLLETPQEEMQYSFRTSEGTVTYGVLKVEDDNMPQIVTGANFANTGVQQVITSSLNGQLYVIGNPNEVYVSSSAATTRAIAPRQTIVENSQTVSTIVKKKDDRRRATHNEVERRRRDKINNWIARLSKIIPENPSPEMKGNGHYDGQSKGGILAKACDYIMELRDNQQKMEQCAKENKRLTDTVESLKLKNGVLERENRTLREVLRQKGVEVTDASS